MTIVSTTRTGSGGESATRLGSRHLGRSASSSQRQHQTTIPPSASNTSHRCTRHPSTRVPSTAQQRGVYEPRAIREFLYYCIQDYHKTPEVRSRRDRHRAGQKQCSHESNDSGQTTPRCTQRDSVVEQARSTVEASTYNEVKPRASAHTDGSSVASMARRPRFDILL